MRWSALRRKLSKSEWWQLLKGCYKGLRTWLAKLRVLGSEQNPNGSKARQKGGENTAEKKDGESWLKPSPSAEIFRT